MMITHEELRARFTYFEALDIEDFLIERGFSRHIYYRDVDKGENTCQFWNGTSYASITQHTYDTPSALASGAAIVVKEQRPGVGLYQDWKESGWCVGFEGGAEMEEAIVEAVAAYAVKVSKAIEYLELHRHHYRKGV